MDRDNVDAISEALSQLFGQFQNTLEQYAVNQLTLYTDIPQEWRGRQLQSTKQFQQATKKLVEQFKNKLNKPIDNAFKEIFADAQEDVEDVTDDDVKKAKRDDIVNKFKFSVNINIDNVEKSALAGFKRMVNNVGEVILEKKITSGDRLFETINNVMDKNLKDMFVTYKNGRKVHFKSYMEMNVRTTMQQEALNYQYEAAKSVGVMFYLCSSHGDCANDHKDYQGKVYYDENWRSVITPEAKEVEDKVAKYIRDNNLMTIQSVRDNKPFLCTRPNCRHTFKPITITQALTNTNAQLLNKFKMYRGKYDSEKYKNLQLQRKYERDVRKAKEQRDNTIIELNNAKDPEAKEMLTERLKREKSIVTKHQRQLNQLVKGNPYLERDYRRENYKAIVQDVGVKYNKDKKV